MRDPESVVRDFCAAWSRRNVDELLGYFTADAVYHNMPVEPMTNDPARITIRRGGWDAPERSPAQERFYRELMAVERLPSAPEIAQRLLVAINREDAHARHLTALIVRDQSLSARLLRLANSAFFSIRTRVTSIHHATTLLGFARVRDLALGLSVWGALEGKGPGA